MAGKIPETIVSLVSGDSCAEVSASINDISGANTVFHVNIGTYRLLNPKL